MPCVSFRNMEVVDTQAVSSTRNRHSKGERNLKSIRLDCIEGNDIPQKMYMSFGFKYVDKVEIIYVDIGVPRKFLLYEFVL